MAVRDINHGLRINCQEPEALQGVEGKIRPQPAWLGPEEKEDLQPTASTSSAYNLIGISFGFSYFSFLRGFFNVTGILRFRLRNRIETEIFLISYSVIGL